MWRIAKALGFKNIPGGANYEYIREWQYEVSSYNHSDIVSAAQDDALGELRKKYPTSVLLQNISTRRRLD